MIQAIDRNTRFWDRIAEKYSRTPVPDEEVYQKKLAKTREYFRPDSKVLEFGCGTGSTAIAHSSYVAQLEAIDVSANMLEIAKDKACAQNITNINFVQSNIDDYVTEPESFDAVLGLSVLHLLKDKDAVLRKVHRTLKPGGVFISSTACIGDKDKIGLFNLIGPIGRLLGKLPILDVFTTEKLRESLVAAGFEIEYDWKPEKSMAVFIVARKASN